ncbi:MAG: quinone-dependent dihydroorotate dehydrogenase [Planctomycetaceae bacterium]|nr:quinone-dependent dihydroorotate dehydrogenase [Planctomycetaceae bacterium]
MLYSRLIRPVLFRLDAEFAHAATLRACRILGSAPLLPRVVSYFNEVAAPELEITVAGLRFSNPLGLAAGWDKSGVALRMLDHLGFGSYEIGSVSACASRGNPRPRLFRLPRDQAILVNYGLPNDGAEVVSARLAKHRRHLPLGVNIVATNRGPHAAPQTLDELLEDYARSAALLHPHASYLTLNLSCPNASGGKDVFAQPGNLRLLLQRLGELNLSLPVFLKVPPCEASRDQERWLTEAEPFEFVRGFQFNLPPGKPEGMRLETPARLWSGYPGAIAGPPVAPLINRCIASLYRRMDRQRYIIIGAGGIRNAADAYLKFKLGATLIQIYTAMIYEGPGIVRRINLGLRDMLRQEGAASLRDVIGTGI